MLSQLFCVKAWALQLWHLLPFLLQPGPHLVSINRWGKERSRRSHNAFLRDLHSRDGFAEAENCFSISFTELRFGLKLHTREHLQQVTCCDLFVFKAVFTLKRSTSRQARTWNRNSEIRSVKELESSSAQCRQCGLFPFFHELKALRWIWNHSSASRSSCQNQQTWLPQLDTWGHHLQMAHQECISWWLLLEFPHLIHPSTCTLLKESPIEKVLIASSVSSVAQLPVWRHMDRHRKLSLCVSLEFFSERNKKQNNFCYLSSIYFSISWAKS